MATNLFGDYPKISYTLDDGDSEQVVVDIFKRVILSKEFQENISYFETYEVLQGETPEDVSYRFYGTPSLHWLILMVNNVIDPRFNWPLSEDALYKNTVAKYSSDTAVFAINRALNENDNQVETFFILTEDSTHKNPKRLIINSSDSNQVDTFLAYKTSEEINRFESNYEVEQNKNESYRNIKILKADIVDDILTNYKNVLAQ
jgi:hypothetical protein